ncbi:hypothetical protein [Amycolatopsis sp. NBC_01286]|uniref:hypothetical protein n=1 Tax=Amycolatopsis sp. NBC_01286 TaxID=2903560 RepID=UPI002E0F7E91|nr:hypothetical protein OG570_48135 [Amycolatopsis sp. NBC_01286]
MSDLLAHAGIDSHRLIAAAHEVAHAIGFAAAGVAVTEIEVYGHGENAAGHVFVPGGIDVTNLRGFAVAHFAGRAADLRWCDEHQLPPAPERTCATDMAMVREFIRDAGRETKAHGEKKFSPGLASLRSEATRFVRAHWSTVARLAPRLARTGSLNPDRIPLAIFP